MTQNGTEISHMRLQTSNDIFLYWNSIRGERDAPSQAQIDPAALGRDLANLFILEDDGAGNITFRLAGQRICDLFGQDLRATDFARLWGGSDRQDILDIAVAVMQNGTPTVISATGQSTDGREAGFEIVLLPIVSSDDRSDRMLGAISSVGADSWLALVPLELLTIEGSRALLEAPSSDPAGSGDLMGGDRSHHGTLSQVAKKLMSYF